MGEFEKKTVFGKVLRDARKEKTRKEKRKRELTARVPSKRVAHDFYVTSHCTLSSEAIQTIGID